MEGTDISGFFEEEKEERIAIGAVYNRKDNWIFGVSNGGSQSKMHIFRNGVGIGHTSMKNISQCE